MYYGNGEYRNPQEDVFIARLLRGFNYNDCLEYEDPNSVNLAFGKLSSRYQEYSPVLCRNCSRTCGAKLSKWTVNDHPAIVITHQRLFLSNDQESIAENISGRKVLIIDEKIETKDMGDVLLEQWEALLTKFNKFNLSDKTKEEVKKIGSYLRNLEYPERSDGSIVKISPYDPTFKFDSTLFGILRDNNEDIQNLVDIEKFLNYGGTTSRNWRKKDKEQFTYIRYIDLESYTKHFKKTIILDATSAIDEDYQKSNVVFLDGLNKTEQRKINIYYSPQRTIKRSLIIDNNTKTDEEKGVYRTYKGNRKFYNHNVELLALEIQNIITESKGKTLIICYKSIVDKYGTEFNLEDDLTRMLKDSELNSKDYTVRHFGAATTGVNAFRDYKNIIFIGMLNKGSLYYTNKTLAIGNDDPKATELNEQVIDCIQQIGRICVRQGEEANVYMLFEDKLGLTQELRKYFIVKEKEWHPKYFNGINNATEAKQRKCWYSIVEELKKMNEGEELSLKELQDRLKSGFKGDTVYRSVTHGKVLDFIAINSISYSKVKNTFIKNKKITKPRKIPNQIPIEEILPEPKKNKIVERPKDFLKIHQRLKEKIS